MSESAAEPEGSAARKRRSPSTFGVIAGFFALVIIFAAVAALIMVDNANNASGRVRSGSDLTASESHGRQLFAPDTLPVILSLIDQLHEMRQRLRSLSAAVMTQDKSVQAAIIAAMERDSDSPAPGSEET